MRNLTSAICITAGGLSLGFYGWNWWFFAVFLAGILFFRYLPEKDRQLTIRNLQLNNELLEEKIREKKCGGKRK